MYNKIKHKIICFFAILNFLAITPALSEIVVVVNSGSKISHASAGEIKALFLGRTKIVAGQPMLPLDQKEGDTRDYFNSKLLGKSDTEIREYWAKLYFSGKGRPPKRMAGDEEVKKYLSVFKNYIGYINSRAVDDSVKVILTIK